jgi:septum formation protein
LDLEGRRTLAKPADRDAARGQLRALRGRSHEVHSAIAFVQDGTVLYEHVSVARMVMRTFSDQFLESYLDACGQAATANVGAYQIKERDRPHPPGAGGECRSNQPNKV